MVARRLGRGCLPGRRVDHRRVDHGHNRHNRQLPIALEVFWKREKGETIGIAGGAGCAGCSSTYSAVLHCADFDFGCGVVVLDPHTTVNARAVAQLPASDLPRS